MAERLLRRFGLAWLAGCCVLAAVSAAPAQACDSVNQQEFGLSPGCLDIGFTARPVPGNVAPDYFQAGGHPYEVTTAMRLNAPAARDPVHNEYWPSEILRDARFGLPPGLLANPSAVPPCSLDQLTGSGGNAACPPESQVGVMTSYYPAAFGGLGKTELPLFRLDTPPGGSARFGFNTSTVTSVFDAVVGSGDAPGLEIDISKLSEGRPIIGLNVSLWGVPSDPSHTPKRACPGQTPPAGVELGEPSGPTCAANLSTRAFLRLPTSCTGPAPISVRFDSWQHPGVFKSGTSTTHLSPGLIGDPTTGAGYPAAFPGLTAAQWGAPQGFEGCNQLPFNPSIDVEPSNHAADSPTGLDLEVSFPLQGVDDPDAISEADLKKAVMTLPAGMSLNPAVANGLTACSAAQVDLDSSGPASCPDSSKLGTVKIASPLLEGEMSGSIYVAEPESGGNSAALPAYVVTEGGGMVVKLLSSLDIDKATGRVSTTLSGTPQIPIESLQMHFFDGQRAPFVNPPTCGVYTSQGRFTPRSGTAPVDVTDSFQIGSGLAGSACPDSLGQRPFHPGFRAGVTSLVAGAASSLTMKLTRNDGEQEVGSLDVSMPPGLVASLRGVATCSEATLAATAGRSGLAESQAPSCPAASRIGTATAAVGAGTEPFYMKTGRIYLAGPYEGAAFSFAVVLPTVAGPIDLETMTMRLPLTLDPIDGHLTLKTTFPSTPSGVALKLRQLNLDIDRPDFISNPTSCRPASIEARIGGDGGAVASVSSPFQMFGCSSLGFGPKLGMSILGSAKATRHTSHPAIRSTLTTRDGDTGTRRAAITFPASQQLEPDHIRGICKRAQFAAQSCPADSIYGYAKVLTPLLDKPLTGPVYMRDSDNKLPDLVAHLGGQVDLDLSARIGFADGRVRIVMDSLPDVPISKLFLTTYGGRRGLFVNNRNLCAGKSFATADLTAQNGKRSHRRSELRVPCGS